MTIKYEPGDEDIFLVVEPRQDGNVTLGIHLVATRERIYGVVLPPGTARSAAEKLTLASWKAEDFKNGI